MSPDAMPAHLSAMRDTILSWELTGPMYFVIPPVLYEHVLTLRILGERPGTKRRMARARGRARAMIRSRS